MVTVIVVASDVVGEAVDGSLTLSPVHLQLGVPVVTAVPVKVRIPAAGGTFETPASPAGNALQIRPSGWGVSGLVWTVRVPPVSTITLADLVRDHSVDPTWLLPIEYEPSLEEALEDIREFAAAGGTPPLVHQQSIPLATWVIGHTLGRLPRVAVYLSSGEEIEADVVVSTTAVSITFATPTAGSAVIS